MKDLKPAPKPKKSQLAGQRNANKKTMIKKKIKQLKKNVRNIDKKKLRRTKEARDAGVVGVTNHKPIQKTNRLSVPNMKGVKQKMIDQLKSKKQNSRNKSLLNTLLSNKTKHQNTFTTRQKLAEQEGEWEDVREFDDDGMEDPKEKQAKKQFMKDFHKVLEMADIIIEVLDARDPINCRCKEAERLVASQSREKKLIIVLNKIDLVPLPVVFAWKKELERNYAVVLFKANTQRQTINYGQNKLYQNSLNKNPELVADMLKSTKSLGTHKLLELIKNYSREGSLKKAVTVGVIGFPNVGKSSIINSLKRKRAAGVSSNAGFTRSLQEIEIDSKVKIIDSPGVILSNESEAVLVLHNQINASDVKDPLTPIKAILDRCSAPHLKTIYKLDYYKDEVDFLYQIATLKGKFKKAGVADLEAAARIVITDWNSGKMKHYLPPPGFDPTILVDVEQMKKELEAMQDPDQTMVLESVQEEDDWAQQKTGKEAKMILE